jgi:acetoin utilization deacetylase AcuC-like enzyme
MKKMMKKTAFIYHPLFLKHVAWCFHPERPDRLEAIVNALREQNLWHELIHVAPQPAELSWIEKIHDQRYIDNIKNAFPEGRTQLNADTGVNEFSFDAAVLAVGAAMTGVDCVMNGNADFAFCAVRPPGHHAEHNESMGFCLFNNAVIAARYAQIQYKLERIFILDWDVHHGNGTQHSFESDPTVFYCSLHQWPLYPGTGSAFEKGVDAGKGFTLNIPLPAGSDDQIYIKQFHEAILPAIDQFQPELILISAGFDAHSDDPLAMMELSTSGFGEMTRLIINAASKHCQGKIVSLLEGGYNIQSLSASICEHIKIALKTNTE